MNEPADLVPVVAWRGSKSLTVALVGCGVLSVALLSSCREYLVQHTAQRALKDVGKELSASSGIEPSDLRARFSPIGEGLFVYPADVLRRGQPPVVWLIKAGSPYVLNARVHALTPALPGVNSIPKEDLTSEEQSGQLEAMVWHSLVSDPRPSAASRLK